MGLEWGSQGAGSTLPIPTKREGSSPSPPSRETYKKILTLFGVNSHVERRFSTDSTVKPKLHEPYPY